mmetsp:Transcript_113868/g.207152  ORF Transcript_113868/g.207152 Transcript_113868/m.207152 type:complete len:405 (-) Transcript_113868:107-1321(-)
MDRYERVRTLGRGSYATVVLARLVEDNSVLRVIKEVDLARADDKSRTQALQEAEVLKSLSHPNIVAYHDAQLARAQLCIVMEYADAGDLAAAVTRRKAAAKRYHEREAMGIFVQLAMALHYIHERRVLHRDLKCQNVFLMRTGVVKLGDFGIAKVLEAADSMAETRIGTPYYLPPEMCTGKPYDFRADVWCLGVVLYEVLALQVPFDAPNMALLVTKICSNEPRPVPQVYSSDLRVLLGRMMAKRAEDRPTSAEIVALPHVRRALASLLIPGSRSSSRTVESASGMVAQARSPTPDALEGSVGVAEGKSTAGSAPAFSPAKASCAAELSLLDKDLPVDLIGEVPSPVHGVPSSADPSRLPDIEWQPLDGDGEVRPTQNSLRHALESSMACEKLLRELEQEFNLA